MNPQLRERLTVNLGIGNLIGCFIPWGLVFGIYSHYFHKAVENPDYIPKRQAFGRLVEIIAAHKFSEVPYLEDFTPLIMAMVAFLTICVLRALIEPYTFENELFKDKTSGITKFFISHAVFFALWIFAFAARATELTGIGIWPFKCLWQAPENGWFFWYMTLGLYADLSYRGMFETFPKFDVARLYQRPPGSQRQDPYAVNPNQPPPGVQFYRLPKDPNAYDRVIGLKEAKTIMQESLNMMLDTEEGKRMKKYGLAPPRGIMLYGPPGTGKTSFARASAQVLGLPFLVVNASSITGSLVGSTERNINAIFDFAARNAPCVVFWDEIDAVGKKRTGDDNNSPSQLALNVLLARMDGFARQTNVILIAATNRLDILDDALIRPGRFDCHIYVGLPDVPARKEIIKLYCRNRPVDISDSEYEELAELTEGMSPAELEALVAEAAKAAYYEGSLICCL